MKNSEDKTSEIIKLSTDGKRKYLIIKEKICSTYSPLTMKYAFDSLYEYIHCDKDKYDVCLIRHFRTLLLSICGLNEENGSEEVPVIPCIIHNCLNTILEISFRDKNSLDKNQIIVDFIKNICAQLVVSAERDVFLPLEIISWISAKYFDVTYSKFSSENEILSNFIIDTFIAIEEKFLTKGYKSAYGLFFFECVTQKFMKIIQNEHEYRKQSLDRYIYLYRKLLSLCYDTFFKFTIRHFESVQNLSVHNHHLLSFLNILGEIPIDPQAFLNILCTTSAQFTPSNNLLNQYDGRNYLFSELLNHTLNIFFNLIYCSRILLKCNMCGKLSKFNNSVSSCNHFVSLVFSEGIARILSLIEYHSQSKLCNQDLIINSFDTPNVLNKILMFILFCFHENVNNHFEAGCLKLIQFIYKLFNFEFIQWNKENIALTLFTLCYSLCEFLQIEDYVLEVLKSIVQIVTKLALYAQYFSKDDLFYLSLSLCSISTLLPTLTQFYKLEEFTELIHIVVSKVVTIYNVIISKSMDELFCSLQLHFFDNSSFYHPDHNRIMIMTSNLYNHITMVINSPEVSVDSVSDLFFMPSNNYEYSNKHLLHFSVYVCLMMLCFSENIYVQLTDLNSKQLNQNDSDRVVCVCYNVVPVLSNLCLVKRNMLKYVIIVFEDSSMVYIDVIYLLLVNIIYCNHIISFFNTPAKICPLFYTDVLACLVSGSDNKNLSPVIYQFVVSYLHNIVKEKSRWKQVKEVSSNQIDLYHEYNYYRIHLLSLCYTYCKGHLNWKDIDVFVQFNDSFSHCFQKLLLKIYNIIIEWNPNDGMNCLNSIQTMLKFDDSEVRSDALCALTRLCSNDILSFEKVWTILNASTYSFILTSVDSSDLNMCIALSNYLSEFVLNHLIQGVMKELSDLRDHKIDRNVITHNISICMKCYDLLYDILHRVLYLRLSDSSLNDNLTLETEYVSVCSLILCSIGRLIQILLVVIYVLPEWNDIISNSIEQKADFDNVCVSILEGCSHFKTMKPHIIKHLLKLSYSIMKRYYQLPSSSSSSSTYKFESKSIEYACSKLIYFCIKRCMGPYTSRLNESNCNKIMNPSVAIMNKNIASFFRSRFNEKFNLEEQSTLYLAFPTQLNNVNRANASVRKPLPIIIQLIIEDSTHLEISFMYSLIYPISWDFFFKKLLKDSMNSNDSDSNELENLSKCCFGQIIGNMYLNLEESEFCVKLFPSSDMNIHERWTPTLYLPKYINALNALTSLTTITELSPDITDFLFNFIIKVLNQTLCFDESKIISNTYMGSFSIATCCITNLAKLFKYRSNHDFIIICFKIYSLGFDILLNVLSTYSKHELNEDDFFKFILKHQFLDSFNITDITYDIIHMNIQKYIAEITPTNMLLLQLLGVTNFNMLEVLQKYIQYVQIIVEMQIYAFIRMLIHSVDKKSNLLSSVEWIESLHLASIGLAQTILYIGCMIPTANNLELVFSWYSMVLKPIYLNFIKFSESNPHNHSMFFIFSILILPLSSCINVLLKHQHYQDQLNILDILKDFSIIFSNSSSSKILLVKALRILYSILSTDFYPYIKKLPNREDILNYIESINIHIEDNLYKMISLGSHSKGFNRSLIHSSSNFNVSHIKNWEYQLSLLIYYGIPIFSVHNYRKFLHDSFKNDVKLFETSNLYDLMNKLSILPTTNDTFNVENTVSMNMTQFNLIQILEEKKCSNVHITLFLLHLIYSYLTYFKIHSKIDVSPWSHSDETSSIILILRLIEDISDKISMTWTDLQSCNFSNMLYQDASYNELTYLVDCIVLLNCLLNSTQFSGPLPHINLSPLLSKQFDIAQRILLTCETILPGYYDKNIFVAYTDNQPKDSRMTHYFLLVRQIVTQYFSILLKMTFTNALNENELVNIFENQLTLICSSYQYYEPSRSINTCYKNPIAFPRYLFFYCLSSLPSLVFSMRNEAYLHLVKLTMSTLYSPEKDPVLWIYFLQQLNSTIRSLISCFASHVYKSSKFIPELTNTVAMIQKKNFLGNNKVMSFSTYLSFRTMIIKIIKIELAEYLLKRLSPDNEMIQTSNEHFNYIFWDFAPTIHPNIFIAYNETIEACVQLILEWKSKDYPDTMKNNVLQDFLKYIPVQTIGYLISKYIIPLNIATKIFYSIMYQSDQIQDNNFHQQLCMNFSLMTTIMPPSMIREMIRNILQMYNRNSCTPLYSKNILNTVFLTYSYPELINHYYREKLPPSNILSKKTLQSELSFDFKYIYNIRKVPIFRSRDIFHCDSGCYYFSEIQASLNSEFYYLDPILLNINEEYTSTTNSDDYMFRTVFFPLPSCLAQTVLEGLTKNVNVYNTQFKSNHDAAVFTTTQYECYLNQYIYNKTQNHNIRVLSDFQSSYHTDKRLKLFLYKFLLRHYQSYIYNQIIEPNNNHYKLDKKEITYNSISFFSSHQMWRKYEIFKLPYLEASKMIAYDILLDTDPKDNVKEFIALDKIYED